MNKGEVLIVGGQTNSGVPLSSAELYNPATGTFTTTGSLNTARANFTATLLNNGLALIAAGIGNAGTLSSAELYNPATGIFTVTNSLNYTRDLHTATLLNSGMVLIAGGFASPNAVNTLPNAELYNPTTGTFTSTGSMNEGRAYDVAALLNDGTALKAGGDNTNLGLINTAELYNPATGSFTFTGNMNAIRVLATGTLLGNGNVLVAGGWNFGGYLNSAELYHPVSTTHGSNFASANSTTISTSVTPTLSNDFAVVVLGTQSSIGQNSPILPPGYTSISADTRTTIAYRQLASTATESPSNSINLAEWAEGLVLLVTKAGTSAAFRSTSIHELSGSISAPTQTLVPANPYLAGSTVLVCLRAERINTNGGPPTITKITDNQNTYVGLGAVAIGGAPGGADGAAVEIWGATNVVGGTPTITVTIGGNGGWSGVLGAYEFTGAN